MDNTRLRSQGIIHPDDLGIPITIIGAGSIGSFTALALTKMGCSNVTVYDPQGVAEENVGCQLYGPIQKGSLKVDALEDLLVNITGIEIITCPAKWTSNSEESQIVISAVDTLAERVKIWDVLQADENVSLYIDGRMGGELMRIYTVDMTKPDSFTGYEKSLVGRKAEHIPCSERSIVYNTLICGGLIAHQVKRYVKDEELKPEIIFDIPSLTII